MIFDAITMLAVLEHITPDQHFALVSGCARLLRQGGQLIITVPSPAVDHILAVLTTIRLVDGMSLEQHHGFEPHQTADIFCAHGFQPIAHHRFQLGLNNLFVFQRDTIEAPSPAGVSFKLSMALYIRRSGGRLESRLLHSNSPFTYSKAPLTWSGL